jgi:SPP1 family predicted phage head-tail adaptor
MKVGKLNRRIDIKYPVKTSDGMGGSTIVWTNSIRNAPCAIWPVSAKQLINAGQQTMFITHRVRMRKRDGVKSSWRLYYRDRVFDIVSIVEPDMDNRWYDIMCREIEE